MRCKHHVSLNTSDGRISRPARSWRAIRTSGRGNLSFARLALIDGSRAMIGIAPNHHLALFARRAAALGRTLEIAVIIGAHPAVQLAACLYLGVGDDEMECAGRLLGEPVRVIKARTVDLMVPAEAELVLKGRIDADRLIEEGLVSEISRYVRRLWQRIPRHLQCPDSPR